VKLPQAPTRPDEVTQPEPARPVPAEPVVRQVSRFIKVMVDSQRSEVRLNLHPEQLGSVAVKLVLEGAQVKASLTAQDAAVKQVLEANLDQLRTRLADQGLHVTEVHVAVGDDGGFGQPQQSHQGGQQKQPDEQPGRPAFRQMMPEEEAATPDPTRSTTPAWARRWMGSRINSLA
jgi:flagellar hook-length control protein FliK